ncbi:MAG: hypothetical protein WA398_06785 [Nitrososphaeraceae archaeon]
MKTEERDPENPPPIAIKMALTLMPSAMNMIESKRTRRLTDTS